LAGFGWIWTGLWLNLLRGALFGLLTLWTVHFGANGLAISRSATCIVHSAIVLAWIVAVTNAAGKKCRSTGGEPRVLSRFMAGEANEATHAA